MCRQVAVRWLQLNGGLVLQTHSARHSHHHVFPPPPTQQQQQQQQQEQQQHPLEPHTGAASEEEQFRVNCRFCNKAFHGRYSKYNMKRHLMIHRGEKPFLCPYCPHRANQKGNLKYHILSVHQGEPAAAQYLAMNEQSSDAANP